MMPPFCNCWTVENEKDFILSNFEENKSNFGTDRILKLSRNENLSQYSQNFKPNPVEISKSQKETIKKEIENLYQKDGLSSFSCAFCGGENCEEETPKKNSIIKGLNSDIFENCIYTSQRPSTVLIKKYNILQQFKKNKIKLIINCQIPGEHKYCGPNQGLELESGFTYCPSLFISEGINVLYYGFEEDSCPFTFDFMIDIVKNISYIIKYKNEKVFVHSHSGNDRSCLIVACFLIFYFNKTSEEAIEEIKQKRSKAFSKDCHIEYCKKFEIYVNILKTIFSAEKISINNFIKYQNELDFNLTDDNRIDNYLINLCQENKIFGENLNLYNKVINLKFIPKIIRECLSRILFLQRKGNVNIEKLYEVLNGKNKLDDSILLKLQKIKNDTNNNNFYIIKNNENLVLLTEIMFSWLNECVIECINPKKINEVWIILNRKFMKKNKNFNEIIENDDINLVKNDVKDMIYLIKGCLNTIEFELIKYISLFLRFIYPSGNNSNYEKLIQEYIRFLYKICLFLMGYNLDKVNALFYENNLKEKQEVRKLILIIELFIFYNDKKEEKKEINNINHNSQKINWVNSYYILKKEYEKEIYSDSVKDRELLFFEFKKDVDFYSIKNKIK